MDSDIDSTCSERIHFCLLEYVNCETFREGVEVEGVGIEVIAEVPEVSVLELALWNIDYNVVL